MLQFILDLTGCAGIDDDDTPPPLPPRDPDMLPATKVTDESSLTQSLSSYSLNHKKLIRRGSEHSLINYSLSNSEQLAKDKSRSLEKSAKAGKKKGNKKSETFSGRGTPTCASLHASPNRSNMYFGSSPTHTSMSHAHLTSSMSGSSGNILAVSSSIGGGSGTDVAKTPKKNSRWTNIRNKMGKKFSRGSVSTDSEDCTGKHHRSKPQRSQSIPSSRKAGVYVSVRNASVSGEEMSGMSYTDGGAGVGGGGGVAGAVLPRHRKSSSSYTNNVNLVAKIFSVLNCWVDEYFEVSRVKLLSAGENLSSRDIRLGAWVLFL